MGRPGERDYRYHHRTRPKSLREAVWPLDPAVIEPLESEVQRACIELLRQTGWRVWPVGQRDARGTQAPGVPDVIAIHPSKGVWFFEMKRPSGRVRPEQQEFQSAVRDAAHAGVHAAARAEDLRSEGVLLGLQARNGGVLLSEDAASRLAALLIQAGTYGVTAVPTPGTRNASRQP